MNRKTKGTIEAEVASAVVRFHREQLGRGPADVRAVLIADMVLVRSAGIFTATESRLSATEEGKKIVRSARKELRSINHLELEELVATICTIPVLRSFYDLNVDAAEQVEVFILESDLEKKLLRQDLDHLNSLAPRKT